MPTYQYSCTDCGHFFEAVQSFADDSLTVCPECEGRLRKVFNAVGVVFKGSGFYRTDSRQGQKNGATSGSSSAGSDSGSSGSDSGSSGSDSGSSGSDSGSSTSDSSKSSAAASSSSTTSTSPSPAA